MKDGEFRRGESANFVFGMFSPFSVVFHLLHGALSPDSFSFPHPR